MISCQKVIVFSLSMTFLAVIAITVVGLFGDYFLKLSGSGSRYIDWKFFLLGALIYSSTAIGWFFVMKHMKLGALGVVYAITIVAGLAAMGTIFFKESLSWYEVIGIGLGILSIVLLARFA